MGYRPISPHAVFCRRRFPSVFDSSGHGARAGTDHLWEQYFVVRVPSLETVVTTAVRDSGRSVDEHQIRAWLANAVLGWLRELCENRSEFGSGELDELVVPREFDVDALWKYLGSKGAVGVAIGHKLTSFLRDVVAGQLIESVRAGEFDAVATGFVDRSNELQPDAAVFTLGGQQCDTGSDRFGRSRRGDGVAPYPRAVWATAGWWATSVANTEMSRDRFARLWVGESAPPKPPVREYSEEVRGWSGLLADRGWVRAKYGATALILAKSNIVLDSPEAWNTVSRLYVEHVDTLARFSAQFAGVAHDFRPAGLPKVLGDAVKCYARQVPPHVRRAMSGPPQPGHTGGVVDGEATALSFADDPEIHENTYRPMALRKYASVLLDKGADLDDALVDIHSAFARSVERLAPYGDPELPLRPATQREERHVDALLARAILADGWVAEHPAIVEAYGRARKTMLRRTIEGEELTDATILYKKLKSAKLDAHRQEARIVAREVLREPSALAESDSAAGVAGYSGVHDRDVLDRARNLLREFAANGADDFWEKRCAIALLDDPRLAQSGRRGLRAVAAEAWRTQAAVENRPKPAGAVCVSVNAGAGYVMALLFWALSSVAHLQDVPGLVSTRSMVEAIALRFREFEDVLDEHRGGDEEGQ
jgi:hypothetical protein